jgi:hypothetical protein
MRLETFGDELEVGALSEVSNPLPLPGGWRRMWVPIEQAHFLWRDEGGLWFRDRECREVAALVGFVVKTKLEQSSDSLPAEIQGWLALLRDWYTAAFAREVRPHPEQRNGVMSDLSIFQLVDWKCGLAHPLSLRPALSTD